MTFFKQTFARFPLFTQCIRLLLVIFVMSIVPMGCQTGGRQPLKDNRDFRAVPSEKMKSELDRLLGEFRSRPQLRYPDLNPVRPTVRLWQNAIVEIFGEVENDGDADAGPFKLQYEAWFIDQDGNNSGPVRHEEQWPGLARGQSEKSDMFIPPADRFRYDITGMTCPIGIAIIMTVDPWDQQHPNGEVLETQETWDNDKIYSDNPENPRLPWLIHCVNE